MVPVNAAQSIVESKRVIAVIVALFVRGLGDLGEDGAVLDVLIARLEWA